MAAEGLPTQLACRVLGVSESGFYAWRVRPPSPRAIRHAWLTDVIAGVHADSRQTYGARRVHAELAMGLGITVGHCAVQMLMHRAGLQGLSGRPRFRRVPHVATASDLVGRQFHRDEPDRLWVTDITEHPTREGKLYCAVVFDVFSRRVVGWSIDSDQETSLVTSALGMALGSRDPNEETVIHSDQGTQSVHLVDIHPAGDRLGAVGLDGVGRRLLRQCHDGVVLEPGPGRALESEALAHENRACHSPFRVPRDLPQPPAPAFSAWHDDTRRIRTSSGFTDSELIPAIRLHGSQGRAEAPRSPGQIKRGQGVGPVSLVRCRLSPNPAT